MVFEKINIGELKRMHLATNSIKTLKRRYYERASITLDYTNKRVYWIEGYDENGLDNIFSTDYDFQHLTSIISGLFSYDILAISGDSLYFQNDGVFSINQLNISNGKTVRNILVHKATYYGLIVLHSLLQPMGM